MSDSHSPLARISPLAALAAQINEAHQAIEEAVLDSLEYARRAGKLLLEAREQVAHGEWLPWLQANVRFSDRTARRYMQIAENWPRLASLKSDTVSDLTFKGAIAYLAKPVKPEATPGPAAGANSTTTAPSEEVKYDTVSYLGEAGSTEAAPTTEAAPPPESKDEVGQVIPEALREVFALRDKIAEACQRQIENTTLINHLLRHPRFGTRPLSQQAAVESRNTYQSLSRARPHAVCPECGADGQPCDVCKGLGWLTPSGYKTFSGSHPEKVQKP